MEPKNQVTVSTNFRFLVTLDSKDSKEGKRRTAQFETGDLSSPSFGALARKVTKEFPGCHDRNEYEMLLKYKANDTWVAMKNTDDLIRAIQNNSNKECMSISANSVKRTARTVTPVEVPSCSVGNVVPPPLVPSDATVATVSLVAGAAVTHVFKKKAVEKKGNNAMSKQKKAKKKGNTSVAAIWICRAAPGDVEQRVLTALAKFKVLKIDNPLRDHIIRLSGYKNIRSPGISKILASLKKNGKIEYSSGNCMRLLPDGMDHAVVKDILANQPSNNAQVHEQIRLLLQSLVNGKTKVKTTEIFNTLASDGEPHTIAELMQLTRYTNTRSPGFANPLSIMTSLGIIHYPTKSKDIHEKTAQATKKMCFPFDDDHVAAV